MAKVAPILYKAVKAALEQAQEEKQPGDGVIVYMCVPIQGEPHIKIVALDEKGATIRRVIKSFSPEDILSGKAFEGLDPEKLGITGDDISGLMGGGLISKIFGGNE